MTLYLTAEQVLFIHYRLVSETGGEHGVRDIGLLESAIARLWKGLPCVLPLLKSNLLK